MGFLTDLFGDEGDRADLYNDYYGQAQNTLRAGFGEFQRYLADAIRFMTERRNANIDQYRADYRRGIDSLQQAITTAAEDMADAFGRQRSLLNEGFNATKASIGQQFDLAQGQLSQRNAFTGLSQTSFGGAQQTALGAERGLQMGLVDERQRLAMSQLLGQQNTLSTQFQMQAGQSMLAAQSGLAGGTLAGMTGYDQSIAQAMMGLAGQANQTYAGIAGLQSGLGDRLASNVGTGFNLGSTLIGAGIGAGTAYLGGLGLGAGLGGAAGGAAGGGFAQALLADYGFGGP